MGDNAGKERMLELLADRALFGLSEEESNELKALEAEFPEFSGDISFEKTAAAIGLGNLPAEKMPAGLQAKILADADKFFAARNKDRVSETAGSVAGAILPETAEPAADIRTVSYDPPKPSFMQWLGWGVAAIACIVLAVNIWQTRFAPKEVANGSQTPETSKKEPTLAEQKQKLLASARDVIRTEWSAPDGSSGLKGDIVWSDAEQKGYMTFRGLPVNDRDKETYQLWLFRDPQEKYPVDGGVFDVQKTGEVIVPVDAKLKVRNPKMFAVTVEKPGGAVVSEREKIAALAKVTA